MTRHPIQPLEPDSEGVVRFKANAIVCYLLDKGPFDMNHLASRGFSQEDQEQFAQLIGYSLTGFCELSYVSDEVYSAAASMAEGGDEKDARIAHLAGLVKMLKDKLKVPMATLFEIHPEDLNRE